MRDKLAAIAVKTSEQDQPIPLHVKISHALAWLAHVSAEAGESSRRANPGSKLTLVRDWQLEIVTLRHTHMSEPSSQPSDLCTVAIGAHDLDGKAARTGDSRNTLDLGSHARIDLPVWHLTPR
jgi:hypothetical protein